MSKYVRILTVIFNTEISFKEIHLFRGAVLKALGNKANLLYHNHLSDNTFRYSYPLVQYKCLHGKATIVCIEEAVDMIGQLLTESTHSLMIGEREMSWETDRIQPARLLVQTWEQPFCYHISRWLPLNSKNYQAYKGIEGEVERVTFLENILKGNLLSMLKGLNIHLEQELFVKITKINEPFLLYNKGVKLMAFNADFNCNLTIPNNVGVGKNASIGFGIVHHETRKKQENENTKTE
ncbi:MAG: hypothetical protein IJL35_13270 [Bacteroidaceae bacterium]|nr:hypothetical protein [Bacteroidaceae bacterium]MBR6046603.1 hypothetical protein [Bacteroidaceae bacterium]